MAVLGGHWRSIFERCSQDHITLRIFNGGTHATASITGISTGKWFVVESDFKWVSFIKNYLDARVVTSDPRRNGVSDRLLGGCKHDHSYRYIDATGETKEASVALMEVAL